MSGRLIGIIGGGFVVLGGLMVLGLHPWALAIVFGLGFLAAVAGLIPGPAWLWSARAVYLMVWLVAIVGCVRIALS
jgi:hypothetical protein